MRAGPAGGGERKCDDHRRPALERRVVRGTGSPVDQVLERPGDSVVELRRDEEERVGLVQLVEERLDRRRLLLAVEVLVVERQIASVDDLDGGAFRREIPRGDGELPTERGRLPIKARTFTGFSG